MKWFLALFLAAAARIVCAQPVLEFHQDLAFRAETVYAFAERSYTQNLRTLRAGWRVDRDPVLLERLQRLMARLAVAAAAERPDFEGARWEIHTCRDCGESASAMAGGKLLVGEEFIAQLAPTDEELAFLLAHEMAHVLAEHTHEFATVARYFLDNGLRREYWDIQHELDESLPVQYRMAFVSAHQELEADFIGCFLGARAGFDPTAMRTLIEKLPDPTATPASSTHPSGELRMQQVLAMLGAAREIQVRQIPMP